MKSVAVNDAKDRISEILSAVENGEEFTVTRSGQPVARIVPAGAVTSAPDRVSPDVAALVAKLKALRDSGKPVDFDIREAIEEGRD